MANEVVVPISLPAEDGVVLAGQALVSGPSWVVLVHDVPRRADLGVFRGWPQALGAVGVSTLTFDLRGHGLSSGRPQARTAVRDVSAALRWIGAMGALQTYVLAVGGVCAQTIAAVLGADVGGLVLISPGRAAIRPEHARRVAAPVLLIEGGWNPQHWAQAQRLAGAIRSSTLIHLPTPESGGGLLEGEWRFQVLDQAVGFIARLEAVRSRQGRIGILL